MYWKATQERINQAMQHIDTFEPFTGKMTRGDFAGNFYGYVAAIPSYGAERA